MVDPLASYTTSSAPAFFTLLIPCAPRQLFTRGHMRGNEKLSYTLCSLPLETRVKTQPRDAKNLFPQR